MEKKCPKCDGQMREGKVPGILKYFFGYKTTEQSNWSLELNVEKAWACIECGYLELFLDPAKIKAKMKGQPAKT